MMTGTEAAEAPIEEATPAEPQTDAGDATAGTPEEAAPVAYTEPAAYEAGETEEYDAPDEEAPADGTVSLTEQGSAVVIEYLPKIYTLLWMIFAAMLLVMAYNFIKRNFFSHWE